MRETRLRAVTVTHNSARFVELMLRSFFATHARGKFAVEFTVLDNNSSNQELERLRGFLDEERVPLRPTGLPFYIAGEQHGVALGRFVEEHPDCTHYLFLDADMWFVESETITTMLEELAAAGDDTFAVQARINGYYLRRVYEGRDGVAGTTYWDNTSAWPIQFEERTYSNRYMSRCSPVCSVVRNTARFRELVASFGLAQAIRFGVGEVFYYDTFSLLTHVMASHGQHFVVSSKTVNHFGETSYGAAGRAARERDCDEMLEQIRAGRGVGAEIFRSPPPTA